VTTYREVWASAPAVAAPATGAVPQAARSEQRYPPCAVPPAPAPASGGPGRLTL
jgi:hypothetical protein